jgi:hypothetical protein
MAEEYRAARKWTLFLELRRNLDKDRGPTALNELPLDISDDDYRTLVRKT